MARADPADQVSRQEDFISEEVLAVFSLRKFCF
jgi:hypothetical protein